MPLLQRGGKVQAAAEPASPKVDKVELDPKYLNTPLNADIVTKKLGTLGSEWNAHRAMLNKALEAYTNAARDLEETNPDGDDDEVKQAIDEIDHSVKQVLDKLQEIEIRKNQLKALKDRYSAHEAVQKPLERYQEGAQEDIVEYTQRTARAKYGHSKEYGSFRDSIWGVHHDARQTAPSLKTYLKAEAGDDPDDDDGLEVTAASRNLTDPITLAPLRIPVRHDGCSHLIERDSAVTFIKQGGAAGISCPVGGCNARWTTFEVDEGLRKQIERDAQKRAKAGGTQKKRKAHAAVEELSD